MHVLVLTIDCLYMLYLQLTDRGRLLNSLHTYFLSTDKIDENTSMLMSVVRKILTCYVSIPFTRFQGTFRTAVACNFYTSCSTVAIFKWIPSYFTQRDTYNAGKS